MHAKPESGGSAIGNRTLLQSFSLARLRFLVEQRARFNELLPTEDWRRRLIARALYSTYQDCLSQGLEIEAKALMAGNPEPDKN